MKVLALVTDAFGGYGGIAQYNRSFVDALARLPGVSQIDVLPRLARDDLGVLPDKVRQFAPHLNRLSYSVHAAALCLARRPDLIFNGHVYHGPLARSLARFSGATLISQLHGTEVWEKLPRSQINPLRQSAAVLCVSGDTKARYEAQIAPLLPTNAVVLNNTFDSRYSPGDRRAARQAFGLTDEFVILTVARLDGRGGYKGHDRVIRALPRLLQRKPATRYFIAGSGEDQARLEELAQALNVARAVRVMGKLPDDQLPDLYRAADLFALPSTGEGFGIVFLEAMASGTPAIGLALGGATDALTVPGLGEAVEPDNFAAALDGIIHRAAAMTTKDRDNLASITRARFGAEVFRSNVERILGC